MDEQRAQRNEVPRVLFVADQTVDDPRTPTATHPGGAELTDAAAIEACPWPVEVIRTGELKPEYLSDFDLHVIANFGEATPAHIEELCRLGRHVLFEHDMRICWWRGNFPCAFEYVHRYGRRCICPHFHLRRLYDRALGAIFLTHRQLGRFRANPWFRPHRPLLVLGTSLMNRRFFERVEHRRDRRRDIDVAVAYSPSPFKGYELARQYCQKRGQSPYVIRDLSPEQVLEVFERTRRFVYLPRGPEAAGRMVLEARFLGCRVVANRNVGICGESWWNAGDDRAFEVVRDGPARFWRLVDRLRKQTPRKPDEQRRQRLWMRPGADAVVNVGLSALQRLSFVGPVARRMTEARRRRQRRARG